MRNVTHQTGETGLALQAMDLANKAIELAGLAAKAAGYAHASRAHNTRRAQASDWRHFTAWCARLGESALPCEPATLCLYLTAHAEILSVNTLRRRTGSISQAHQAAGLESPTTAASVKSVWRGIARSDRRPVHRATPLVVEAMRLALDQLGDDPRDIRDRALLLAAWGGALRRSEVCNLTSMDVELHDKGMLLTIRRSKTDQLGDGRSIAIPYGRTAPYCPVRAYVAWRAYLPARPGPLFVGINNAGEMGDTALADKHVARLVKRVALAAELVGEYSGHSLRAGFATAAAAAGASERSIMAQTGHRSLLIARSYIRPAQLWDENAAAIAAL
jgi:site-specific recombinase XerD